VGSRCEWWDPEVNGGWQSQMAGQWSRVAGQWAVELSGGQQRQVVDAEV